MTLTVRELCAEEFPLVGVLHGHVWRERDKVSMATEMRKYGKHFYSKRKWPYDSVHYECFSLDELAKQVTCSACYSYYGADFYCGKQEARRELMRAAREYVLFDGEVWARCGEPMYLVQTFGLGHNHGGTAMFVEGHYNPNISKNRYVSATDLEGALKLFFETAYGRGDTEDAERMRDCIERGAFNDEHDYVEVLDADSFTTNPEKDGYDGDLFLNGVEAMVRGTDSSGEAGVLLLAMTMAEMVD